MDSIGWKTAQAIQARPGFDYPQLHKYSFSAIKSFWTFFVFGLALILSSAIH
jgi:hypothetical protein